MDVREVRSGVISLPNVVVSDSVGMPCHIDVDSYDETCNYLALKNGIIDLDVVSKEGVTGVVRRPTPHWFSTVVLDYNYDPEMKCPRFLAFLDKVLPDKASQDVMQEWFGYCLTRDTDLRTMMILYGEARTGKSTLSNILEAMVGLGNRSAVPLECFWDRFAPYQTVGKLVNFCGDSSKIDSLAEGVLKRFTGGGYYPSGSEVQGPHVVQDDGQDHRGHQRLPLRQGHLRRPLGPIHRGAHELSNPGG